MKDDSAKPYINKPYYVDTKPWYKYLWPWVAIAITFWTFMSGVGMVYFSYKGSHYSLADGYSKLGKAAFDDQSWHRNALARNINAGLVRNQGKLSISLDPQFYTNIEDLELVILHPADNEKDVYPVLRLQQQVLSTQIPDAIDGWTIKLRNKKLRWEITNKFATTTQAVVKLR